MRVVPGLKKFVIGLVAGVTLLTGGLGAASGLSTTPTAQAAVKNVNISAKGAIAVDANTGQVLYSKNATTPMPIASMTKMLSTYLVLQAIKQGKLSWDQKIPVSKAVAKMSQNKDYANVPLLSTKKYSVRELYNATEIYSANAAITALGDQVAGSPHKFVDQMQTLAKSWGITDAKIYNASGLTNKEVGSEIGYSNLADNAENEMSAVDLATVAKRLLTDFPEVLKTSSIAHAWFEKGTSSQTKMDNRNYMLKGLVKHYTELPVDGLKTGTSDAAGNCFTGTVSRDGNRIITVVLHAGNASDTGTERFTQTAQIMSYVYNNWQATTMKKGVDLAGTKAVKVQDGKKLTSQLKTNNQEKVWFPTTVTAHDIKADHVTLVKKQTTGGKLQAPVKTGTTVANANLEYGQTAMSFVDGSKTAPLTMSLTPKSNLDKANIFVRMWRGITSIF